MNPVFEKDLGDLAQKMALNAVYSSLWSIIQNQKESGEINALLDTILNVKVENVQQERFIVVVGAGASKNACRELKVGKEAAESLKKKLTHPDLKIVVESLIRYLNDENEENGPPGKPESLDAFLKKLDRVLLKSDLFSLDPSAKTESRSELQQKSLSDIQREFGKGSPSLLKIELDRLENVFRLPKDDFETVLYALSEYFPEELNEEIRNLYGYRFHPNLTYEILAHLLKHRFIDAIINFNFDELLDQAIEDELHQGEYHKIISDGDYDASIFDPEAGLRFPIYIKPHGTFSHPSTLRFTREGYYNMPKGIKEAINNLVSGKVTLKGKEKQVPVNLIVIGFKMQSFEFNSILESHLTSTKIHFFLKPPDQLRWSENDEALANFIKELCPVDKPALMPLFNEANMFPALRASDDSKDGHTFDEWFEFLWGKIHGMFAPEYKPRGIERHLFITRLFHNGEKFWPKGSYLRDRTIVEFALAIAKHKQFLVTEHLMSDRFGRYFNQSKKEPPNDNNLCPKTIKEFCNAFGLIEYGYASKAFYSKKRDSHKLIEYPDPGELCNKLLTNKNISDSIRKKLEGNLSYFIDLLDKIAGAEDSEISPRYENIYDNRFVSPVNITTSIALDYYTRFFINCKNCKSIFAVAETGEWLLNKVEGVLSDKTVKVIVADDTYRKDIEKFAAGGVARLDWWLHNQHMTIFLEEVDGSALLAPFQCIYYPRPLRRSLLNPILLKEREDCQLAMEAFFAYWHKATRPTTVVDGAHIRALFREFNILDLSAAATDLWFDDGKMVVSLSDGREVAVPVETLPKLRDASDMERNHWRLVGNGQGIHWPELDEDISVSGLLRG